MGCCDLIISSKCFFNGFMKAVNAYIYIDALSWDIVSAPDFMPGAFGQRFRVKPQFGYSSAAISSVLSGEPPSKHGVFCDFYFNPAKSPFKNFRYIKYLFGAGLHPRCLFNREWTRKKMSQIFALGHGYSGRFSLHSVPFDCLAYFDSVQNRDFFVSRGLSPAENIRDVLEESGINFYMSDWRKTPEADISSALRSIENGAEFLLVCDIGLGKFLRENADNQSAVSARLKSCSENILKISEALKSSGRPYKLSVMSGFGMLPCLGSVDLKKAVSGLNLKYGKDYVAFYEPTMARFWYMNESSREKVRAELSNPKYPGSFISGAQKSSYGISHDGGKFGDDIFLLNDGFQVSPSYISRKPFKAVCGYSPESEGMSASFLSTCKPVFIPKTVADFFKLMKSDVEESVRDL